MPNVLCKFGKQTTSPPPEQVFERSIYTDIAHQLTSEDPMTIIYNWFHQTPVEAGITIEVTHEL